MSSTTENGFRVNFYTLVGAMSLLILTCGLSGYHGLRILYQEFEYISAEAWPAADASMELEIYLLQQALILRRVALKESTDLSELQAARRRTDVAATQLRRTPLVKPDQLAALETLLRSFYHRQERIIALLAARDSQADAVTPEQISAAVEDLDGMLIEFGEFIPALDQAMDRAVDGKLSGAVAQKRPLMAIIAVTTAVAIALALLILYHLHRQITRYRQGLDNANRRIERISEAKSEFLAHMSHEVRTPMSGVMGMLSLLRTSKLDARQWDYVETAINSGKMMLSLLNDVLDLSRVEAGKLELERHPLNLINVCEQVATLMARCASDKAVELVCDLAPDLPHVVVGDEVRLRQVLGNLLGNSVKFTGSGEVVLSVTTESREDDCIRIRFAIQDTGIGIDQDRLAQIFEAFTQADASVNRNYGGTGLGLAISSRLVKLMGSRIEVESWPGIGSRFWFTVSFPVVEEESGVFTVPEQERRKRVLICNDSRSSRRVIEEMLTMWGYHDFDVEESPARIPLALRHGVARNKPYGIVIIDDDMPGTEALVIARTLRTDANLGSPRLVVMVSGADEQMASSLKFIGDAVMVSKPLRRAQTLQALLGKATHERPAAEAPVADESGMSVLLVEDDRVNQKVIVSMLASFGYQADVVNNGMLALSACQSKDYDLILMDCQMPVMDGYQATRELRRLENPLRRIPIIGITANVMRGDREKCLMAGMDDYLAKPVVMSELKAKLEHYLAEGKKPLPASA